MRAIETRPAVANCMSTAVATSAPMPLFLVALATALVIAWVLGEPALRERRRDRLRAQPFPAPWRRILRRRVPYVAGLPAALQQQLKRHIQVFLAEKPVIGCAGLVVDDEIRVTIAAQACLLMLNRRRPDYFANLRQILVYPGAFIVDRVPVDAAGVARDERRALSGESWTRGQVILSWQDVVAGAAVVDDGRNVVIHEFAHQLDQETGAANGAPRLSHRRRYQGWSEAFADAYARLRADLHDDRPTLLGTYAASDPAEFFAVASEFFFERPQALAEQTPAVYAQLKDYYRVDPLAW
jgi:Mlc titration factor MtfA (ptsG expression regulator)